MYFRCPNCDTAIESKTAELGKPIACPECAADFLPDSILLRSDSMNATVSTGPAKSLDTHPIGEKIAHFTIMRRVGRGGFGTVYLAYDNHLNQQVAIKVPRAGRLSIEQANLFLREARIAAQLRDVSHIVPVHEVGTQDEFVYIVTSYIDGRPLSKWIKHRQPDIDESIRLLVKVCDALGEAHARGIVHRDIKPGNILVNDQDEPFLTDFGLASFDDADEESIAERGEILGSVPYMSPEHVRGEGYRSDQRSDIYSLGTILYELLCGRPPFDSSSSSILRHILDGDVKSPRKLVPEVPEELEAICLKAMHLEPDERFASVQEMSLALKEWRQSQEPVRGPVTTARRGIILAVLIVLLVILTAVVTGVLARRNGTSPEAEGTKSVMIEVFPKPDRMIIVPINSQNGQPDLDQQIVLEEGTEKTRLAPGRYLVEVRAGRTILVVERYVPESTDEIKGAYRHSSWEIIDGTIVWPTIRLNSYRELNRNDPYLEIDIDQKIPLSRVSRPERELATASGLTQERIPSRFLLSRTEITVEQWKQVMGSVPKAMTDAGLTDSNLPVVFLTRDEIIEFCERVGARLPTWAELRYASSNCGTTNYPWPNGEFPDVPWTLGAVGSTVIDATQHPSISPPIRGLMSNVAEWTSDTVVIPGPAQFSIGLSYKMHGGNRGVIEAATDATTLGSYDQFFDSITPTSYTSTGAATQRGIGFRIAVSQESQFEQ